MQTTKMREKGTGTIFKSGKHFYLKIAVGGKTKTTTLRGADDKPVTTRREAEAAAALLRPVLRAEQKEEIALHIANAKKLRHEGSFPIDQIWKTYLAQYTRPDSSKGTLKSYEKSLRHFTDWLAAEHPEIQQTSQITTEAAGSFFSYMWNVRHVSGRTFNLYRHALRLIFHHIQEAAGLEANPFDAIHTKPVETESRYPFTEEQVKAIFAGFQTGFFYETEVTRLGDGHKHVKVKRTLRYEPRFKDEMRVLLMLCCWTGCRGQDGCLMRWSNMDLARNIITYVPRKTARKTNNRAVSLPLHPDLAHALQDALAFRNRNKKGEDYIIPSAAERYQRNPSGVQDDVQKIIHCATGEEVTGESHSEHRVCRANRYSLHSFRHTFVTFCANAGVPLDVVADIVGHSSSVMTRHYAHMSNDAKLNAIQTLPLLSKKNLHKTSREIFLEKLQSMTDEQLNQLLHQVL